VLPLEPRALGPSHGQDGSKPLCAPTGVGRAKALHSVLLDPLLWRERLEEFAYATNLAVALADDVGRLLGEYINSRAAGSALHPQHPAAVAGCPFSTALFDPCTCVVDALAGRGRVIVRDGTGMVHFAVPLFLGEKPLGALLAAARGNHLHAELGALEQLAEKLGRSPDGVRQLGCVPRHVRQADLHLLADLLMTLGRRSLEGTQHDREHRELLDEVV